MTNPIVEWAWQIGVKKGVVSGIAALIGLVGVSNLASWGISIDQTALAAAAIGAIGTLRNFLKVKQGWKFL